MLLLSKVRAQQRVTLFAVLERHLLVKTETGVHFDSYRTHVLDHDFPSDPPTVNGVDSFESTVYDNTDSFPEVLIIFEGIQLLRAQRYECGAFFPFFAQRYVNKCTKPPLPAFI